MRAVRIDVDFAPASRRAPALGLLLLAAGVAAALAGGLVWGEAWSAQAAQAGALADIEGRATPQAAAVRGKPDAAELARSRASLRVARGLQAPWSELLSALESAPHENVALLAIEPSIQRQQVRLTAEARQPEAMLDYVAALQSDTRLSQVVLLSHQVQALSPGQPVYIALYAAAIVFFCFFYTALVFNSRETADNLKKSGAFIPGIRPGEQTAKHIDKILSRLTLVGAVYITVVCLLPEFLVLKYNVPFYFGGTSLLIIVVVTMDFWAQVQSYVMSQQYESLLKKANFKAG